MKKQFVRDKSKKEVVESVAVDRDVNSILDGIETPTVHADVNVESDVVTDVVENALSEAATVSLSDSIF